MRKSISLIEKKLPKKYGLEKKGGGYTRGQYHMSCSQEPVKYF